ncbi:hypothetical protein N7495_009263 [Penicillium taxi]|uniref:uncharacterized protein n=1 Tax=Penicillium taxi TaxID=168475 RepID=UPI0025452CB2|nr:uncharacterized protein N7495_009263 [Penicillium taxi]KAJ5884753.1 hypothetical protein N7495_009263 [Penicillium taxi]
MSFFKIDALPIVKTRRALLMLDFQNDFVRPSGALHVPNTPDILETLPSLAAAFRKVGDVVWVRSQYESPVPFYDWNSGDRIVLDREATKPPSPPPPSDVIEVGSDRDSPEPVDMEAFLSGQTAVCCAAQSPGFQFPAPILAAIDQEQDILLVKTRYSALESRDLMQYFRTRFVTELYLCGSLSNVSVYATALDAGPNCFTVTLIEDCLGYRDWDRHKEAMRRMADQFGATGLTADELLQELDWHMTDVIAEAPQAARRPPDSSLGLENIIEMMDVQTENSPVQTDKSPESPGRDDEISISALASQFRAQYSSAGGKRAPVKIKARVHGRKRRPDAEKEAARPRGIGEGDSRLVNEIDISTDAFQRIRQEVSWQKMYHLSGAVPRLVAVQGHVKSDGTIPIYRHPADESPPLKDFTTTVDQVRSVIERVVGHPLNHALIQLYRDGQDSISEHSDKTLDIVRGSFICNVSLGAQRIMTLRTKKSASEQREDTESSRTTQHIPLPHQSLFILGEKTNMRWLHSIRPDKRPNSQKSPEELAFGGERISLTFRHIGTYLNTQAGTIWGQGAVGKTQGMARPVIHGEPTATEQLILAFGQENKASEFDRNAVYGGGFDVVNFVTASTARLVLSGDPLANLRVRLALGENGLRYDILTPYDDIRPQLPVYIDSDGTSTTGDVAILMHLAQRRAETTRPGVYLLQGVSYLSLIEDLFTCWRKHLAHTPSVPFEYGFSQFENGLEGQHYLGGTALSIDDCALWPVLHEIMQVQGAVHAQFVNLNQYYHRVENRGIVRAVLEDS